MTALFYKFISLLPVKKYSCDIPVISVTVKLSLFYILLYHYVVFSTFSQHIRCIGQQNPSATSYHLNAVFWKVCIHVRLKCDVGWPAIDEGIVKSIGVQSRVSACLKLKVR